MSYRLHPLYQRARHLSGQPIMWENPDVVRLQYDMRHDFTEKTSTLSLIGMTAGVDDATDLGALLGEIQRLPEQGHDPAIYDVALGQGRH